MAKQRNRRKRKKLPPHVQRAMKHMPDTLYEKEKAKVQSRGPRYDVLRDNLTQLAWKGDSWGIDVNLIYEVSHDVMSGLFECGQFVSFDKDDYVGYLFKMHWGEYHERVISDNRDTSLGGVKLPHGVSDTFQSQHELWDSSVRDNDGMHPKHGSLLLWLLTTAAKTHPLRQQIETQFNFDEMREHKLEDVQTAIHTVNRRLAMEVTEAFRAFIISNDGRITEDYIQDIGDVIV